MALQTDSNLDILVASGPPMTRTIVVESDLSRWSQVMTTSGKQVWTKVSGKDTAGVWSTFENRVPAGLSIPLHSHHGQDEWFWVLEGSFVFEVGGEKHRLTKGMSLLAPRRIAHRWKKTSDADGRLLILLQPAGQMEEFFETVARLSHRQMQDAAAAARIFADCGMELLGPPMDESTDSTGTGNQESV